MIKKLLFIATLVTFPVMHANADSLQEEGVFAWVNGSSICYKLSDMPKVMYSDGTAILTLGDSTTPELTLETKNGAKLEITYGIYTGISDIQLDKSSCVEKTGKYIHGGNLVIVKNGKQYDINGIEIKKD